MKVCPKCAQTFNDDGLNFCLLDGAALVSTESQATIVDPKRSKRNNALLWVAIAVLVVLIGSPIVAGVLCYKLQRP